MQKGRPTKAARTDFGKRLLAAREELGLSQTEVAEKLGITQSRYADWERYPISLRPDQVHLLCNTLKISVSYLYGDGAKRRGRGGPRGKLRRVFERVSELPRHQQNKVVEFVDAFVAQQRKI